MRLTKSLPARRVRCSAWFGVPFLTKQLTVTRETQTDLIRRLGGPPCVARLDGGAADEAVVVVPAALDQSEPLGFEQTTVVRVGSEESGLKGRLSRLPFMIATL